MQTTDDARLRAEVNVGVLKQENERMRLAVNTIDQERLQKMLQRIKSAEQELEKAHQAKQQVMQQRETMEIELVRLRQENEDLNQKKELTQRSLRQLQVELLIFE